MRTLLAALALCLAAPAFADEPAVHEKCKQPLCHCHDATRPEGCLDKKACTDACAEHGGVTEAHKKHKRRPKTSEQHDLMDDI